MSQLLSSLNYPPFVAAAGAAITLGLPFLEDKLLASSVSIDLLKGANVLALLVNMWAVSVPGRIDEKQDQEMRSGKLNPTSPSEAPQPGYSIARTRTLVSPSGWAFAIWGAIYLGEIVFVVAQLFSEAGDLIDLLPQITVPFIAANICQSLWCASFRPSYDEGWRRYVSVGMLAGTAYALSHVHAIGRSVAAESIIGWYFVPMTLHFGWTTAATLVNLNGSVASNQSTSDSIVIALGHASALVATAFGIGVTLARADPTYGLTLAWALAGCADGMKKRTASLKKDPEEKDAGALQKGARVQKVLCSLGSAACGLASLYVAAI